MKLGRSIGLAPAFAAMVLLPACNRRKPAEVNPIVPSFKVNREHAPLGSAIEITYTWTVEPGAKKLDKDYRALVHFQLEVRMGLYPHPGRGERLALKGEDKGLQEYKVARMELLPQTENIFLVYKEGWHNPEAQPENPSVERTWTKKEALVSFKNPRKDVVAYLQADTSVKFFPQPPVLTVSIGGKNGVVIPIEGSEVFLKKIRVKAADLGSDEWVDLRLAMNQSFVPKLLTPPLNNDDRELGLLVYHLYVGEADKLGPLSGPEVVDAGPLPATAGKAPVPKAPAAAKKP